MLSADSALEAWSRLSTFFDRHLHQSANAGLVNAFEWVDSKDLLLHIALEELPFRIVSAVAESHLREVVGSKAEEVTDLG